MGYLKCKSCGGRYDLKPGELPGQFESCSCGGELEFYDDRGHKRGYAPTYPHNNRSNRNSPLIKLVLFFVVAYIVFHVGGSVLMVFIGTMDSSGHPGGTYLFIIFMAMAITIIGLLWFLFRKR
jgi:hypothetical protein